MRSWGIRSLVLATGALMVAGTGTAQAQGRPTATVTLMAEADGVRPGSVAHLALDVSLPEGVHVQSNAPRDPLLIPTVVSIDPASGVTLGEVVYPPATDFTQAGQATPLAVFEQHFTLGLAVAVPAGQAPGEVTVPVRFRYQACDASTCFAPLRPEFTATLHVLTKDQQATPQHQDVFRKLRFAR